MSRNFHIETLIDGRSKKLSGGPISKFGGMNTNIFIKDKKAISIKCFELNDKLYLSVYNNINPTETITIEVKK